MTENKKTVEKYMEGFRASDHEMILTNLITLYDEMYEFK